MKTNNKNIKRKKIDSVDKRYSLNTRSFMPTRNFETSDIWDKTLAELGPEVVAKYFYEDSRDRIYKGKRAIPRPVDDGGLSGYNDYEDADSFEYRKAIDQIKCGYCNSPIDASQGFCGDYCRQAYREDVAKSS